MKDFLGIDIEIGNTVVFMAPKYRNLVKGTIIDITPQKVRIAYINTWNYKNGKHMTILQESYQIVKVN